MIRSLPHLRAWGLIALTEFRLRVDDVGRPLSVAGRKEIGNIALGAANTWNVLLRNYYLASLTAARREDGTRATHALSVTTVDDAITWAVHRKRPGRSSQSGPWTQRDEPDWSNGGWVAAALIAAGASTGNEIAGAVSLGSSSRQELQTYRNFFAHMNRDTASKVRRIGVDKGVDAKIEPAEIPLQRARGRSQSILADWIDDLWTMTSLFPK